ncbi:carbohydrate esterase family 16 [Pyrrhoderma noxium]|uniref:Carbohydrate esterase family 16 n=1 Tax=Pyrrhoderma noxium TaxID=2282107 RepID=A0A286UUS8_9AGAM|nr:carbohydrate esterase family 16 [Pyrrhoderma noxium]
MFNRLVLALSLIQPLLVEGKRFKNILTFGDSYTDIINIGDGGTAWPVYAADYANLTLFPFARSGATCSNNLTPRPFPSLFESQLPLYFSELKNGTLSINNDESVYTLWIGTNDIGQSALLTGDQLVGVSLVDVVSCTVNWVKTLYDSGARNFIFQNMIPLQNTILYSENSYPNRFWAFPKNATEWNLFMTELTLTGNKLAELMLLDLLPRIPGAHVGLFDSHGLFSDMYTNPQNYLNGTAPLNVTGCINSCVFPLNQSDATPTCTTVSGTDRDSFLWFDELHPSEQADRVVARNIADIILGKPSRWIKWLS